MIAELVKSRPFKKGQEYLSMEARGKSRKELAEYLERHARNPQAIYARVLDTFREDYRKRVQGDRN
jgi:hypothetical protein